VGLVGLIWISKREKLGGEIGCWSKWGFDGW